MKEKEIFNADEGGTIVYQGTDRSSLGIVLTLLLRFALIWFVSFGSASVIVDIYKLPIAMKELLLLTLLFTAVCFFVSSALRKLFSAPILLVFSGAVVFLTGNALPALITLKDYAALSLTGRLLNLTFMTDYKTLEELTSQTCFTSEMATVAVLLSLLCSILAATALRTSGRPFAPVCFLAIFIIPTIAAETFDFSLGFIAFFVGLFGLSASGSSYSLTNKLMYADYGRKKTRKKLFLAERLYVSKAAGFSPLKKLKSDAAHYCTYSLNSFFAGGIAGVSVLILALTVTSDTVSDYRATFDGLINKAVSVATEIGNGIKNSGFSTDGYFSATGGLGSADEILIGAPSSGNKKVLSVELQQGGNPIYLRGDIGVNFKGKSWSSLVAEDTSAMDLLFSETDFYPELEYQMCRRMIAELDPEPSKYIQLQTVRLRYLQNSNIVFMPTAPLGEDYRLDDRFVSYGDEIIRLKNEFGSIGLYESNTISPVLNQAGLLDMIGTARLIRGGLESAISDWPLPQSLGYSDYKRCLENYRSYIKELYTAVPESEETNIANFMLDIYRSRGTMMTGSDPLSAYDSAKAIENYLKKNYEYSLTADNDIDGETVLGAFLNKTKAGHCALFASVMTLAMRSLGVPARYVTGYAVNGPTAGEYTVIESDLHAWTEVYIEGIGWIPFDPTASTTGSEPAPIVTAPAETAEPSAPSTYNPPSAEVTTAPQAVDPFGVPWGSSDSTVPHDYTALIVILSIAAGAILIALLTALIKRAHRNAERRIFSELKSRADAEGVRRIHRLILLLLSFEKIVPLGGELPYEFFSRADKRLTDDRATHPLSPLLTPIERAEFGGGDPSEEEHAALIDTLRYLYRKIVRGKHFYISIPRKLKFLRKGLEKRGES